MDSETKTCRNCKTSFVIALEDFSFYEKMGSPAPVICPDCRFKRNFLFRNERTLYRRTCAKCEKQIISMYHPKSPYVVYCHACYESDTWDPYSYAKDYDPKRPFIEQLGELIRSVPKKTTFLTLGLGPNVNSDYTNMAGGNRNSYLLFNSGHCEDVFYSRGLLECKDSSDIYFGTHLERSYETVNGQQSNGVLFSQNVVGCVNSAFLYACSGCTDCFGCVNLRGKSYYFLNEPLTKDEYKKRVEAIMGSHEKIEEFKKVFEKHRLQFPHRENNNIKTVNAVGEYLFSSKNLTHCFEVTESEDCKYTFSNKQTKDAYDIAGYGYHGELLLGCVGVGLSTRVIGSYGIEDSQNIEYSFALSGSKDCLGCDSLVHAEFCILNKKYPEEEFKKYREQITRELKKKDLYGLCLPPELAPFAYNETIAQDNMPMSREEVLAQGFRWEDDIPQTRGKETMSIDKIPDNIKDVSDTITKEVLACAECGRNYLIIPAELLFYRKMNLPLPRHCFNCRYIDRIRRRGPFKIYERACNKCGKAIQTIFAPDRPEVVYCEQCYQAEVI